MTTEECINIVLRDSDIVWPKYGSITTEELAQKIVAALKELEKENNDYKYIEPTSNSIHKHYTPLC